MNCSKWVSLMFPHDQVVGHRLDFCMMGVCPSQELTAEAQKAHCYSSEMLVLITQTRSYPASPLCGVISDSTLSTF